MKRQLIRSLTVFLATSCASAPRKNPKAINEEALASPIGESGIKIVESTPAEAPSEKASNFVALPNNIMECEGKPGDILKNCKVVSRELAPVQEKLSNFFLSYTMTCGRGEKEPSLSKLKLSLENGQERFLNYNNKGVEVNVGTGKGPLKLEDSFPKELGYRSYNDCQLSIDKLKIEKVVID